VGVSERKMKETEALRQRVLDVAEDIIINEGIRQITMRRIAARIEYAPTVLYRLFNNKNDLMDNLIARGYGGVRERYEAVLKRKNLGPLEALSRILQVYVTYALDHPNHYRMWFDTGELRREDRSLKMNHGRLEYVVFQTWLDCLEACMVDGLFPERDPLEVFQVLWTRIHGLISLRLQHPDFPWMPVDRHLEAVLDLDHEGTRTGS
jgi:AcrR family transcriptional regulator